MNETTNQPRYQPGDFARRAGVTVRALHQYDRLGLLKHAAALGAGYRLYRPADFARLQQIVTLRFIGFPLSENRKLLNGTPLQRRSGSSVLHWSKSAGSLTEQAAPEGAKRKGRASVLVGLQELDEIRHLLFTDGGFKPLGHQGQRTGGDRLNILAENVILLAAGAAEGDAGRLSLTMTPDSSFPSLLVSE